MGHRAVLQSLTDIAKDRGARSMVLSFWPHPRAVLQQDAQKFRLLTSLDEKKEIMRNLGIDTFEIIPFTRDFSNISFKDFFRDYLVKEFGVKILVAGYDHRDRKSVV